MKSVMSSSGDVYRMMRNLVNTMIHSNAEMAAEHEQAIAVTTNTFQSRMRRINELAQTTQQDLGTMKDVVVCLYICPQCPKLCLTLNREHCWKWLSL
jgi:hypothetical protein